MLFLLQITDQLGAFSLGHSISIRRVQTLSTQPSAGPTGFDTALTRHTDHFSSVCVLASRIRVNSTQECKMNKVYKSVWNESIGAWVAVSENSPARGKSSSKKVVAVALLVAGAGASLDAMAASGSGTMIGACAGTDGTGETATAIAISGANVAYCANATGISSIAIGSASVAGGAGTGTDINGLAAGDWGQTTFGARSNATARSATAMGSDSAASGVASA